MASNASGWTQAKLLLLVGVAVVRTTLAGTFCSLGSWGRASGEPSMPYGVTQELPHRKSH